MHRKIFKIGTRTSALALKQAKEVTGLLNKFYPQAVFKIKGIETYGDRDKFTAISEMEGADFFTREIEEELLAGKIDFAVHSAKDLPDKIPQGLVIVAITKSKDPYDALVSKGNLKIEDLKKGAQVGVSSRRRKTQLKRYRPDLKITDIRGNIEERLVKLDSDGFDAIVVASCALHRLGLEQRIAQRIPFKILKPHPLQGSLAIEAQEIDKDLIGLLKVLNGK